MFWILKFQASQRNVILSKYHLLVVDVIDLQSAKNVPKMNEPKSIGKQ